jgi:3'-phosphoadenosine 5'-phosphosulfate (PAPS) 3'-phosphatase
VILQIYESEAGAWEVEQKADSSPLTRADREANALICGVQDAAGPTLQA